MPNNISFNTLEISYYADRFICGGEALKQHRTVSRKRVALIELFDDYPDKQAIELYMKLLTPHPFKDANGRVARALRTVW